MALGTTTLMCQLAWFWAPDAGVGRIVLGRNPGDGTVTPKTPTCEARQIPGASKLNPHRACTLEVVALSTPVQWTQGFQESAAWLFRGTHVLLYQLQPLIAVFLLLLNRYERTNTKIPLCDEVVNSWLKSVACYTFYACHRVLALARTPHPTCIAEPPPMSSMVSLNGSSFPCRQSWANCAGEKHHGFRLRHRGALSPIHCFQLQNIATESVHLIDWDRDNLLTIFNIRLHHKAALKFWNISSQITQRIHVITLVWWYVICYDGNAVWNETTRE